VKPMRTYYFHGAPGSCSEVEDFGVEFDGPVIAVDRWCLYKAGVKYEER